MLGRVRNILSSLQTYADLGPDLAVRHQVNQWLNQRTSLTAEQWFQTYWQPLDVSSSVANFAYTHLSNYSGLDFSRVCPTDRLIEDLKFPLVCWFDWQMALCDDFWECFGIDLSEQLDSETLPTIQDLVLDLNRFSEIADGDAEAESNQDSQPDRSS